MYKKNIHFKSFLSEMFFMIKNCFLAPSFPVMSSTAHGKINNHDC